MWIKFKIKRKFATTKRFETKSNSERRGRCFRGCLLKKYLGSASKKRQNSRDEFNFKQNENSQLQTSPHRKVTPNGATDTFAAFLEKNPSAGRPKILKRYQIQNEN